MNGSAKDWLQQAVLLVPVYTAVAYGFFWAGGLQAQSDQNRGQITDIKTGRSGTSTAILQLGKEVAKIQGRLDGIEESQRVIRADNRSIQKDLRDLIRSINSNRR